MPVEPRQDDARQAGQDEAVTPAAAPGRPTVATRKPGGPVPAKIRKALGRYRISAFVVGWGLILLVLAMVLKYGFDMGQFVAIWGPIHGVLYVAYVLLAFDLAYKDRWSFVGILGVLLAGVVPGVSFLAERRVHRRVLARLPI
ncbi:DUF3817 domain-containing protein [Nakamurella flavida]|uniref:DUF3817 domain-containing protein n=1 Tax=Nakamurella flavida TaxID=363630 RepID=A0A938YGU1_9ACTN|nr:DUF3817 domain-containing protein [Nakamurella flavida]MBM9477426.1 DUF3817 domain-containing protein [Nakamurella flavida]MDP9777359.1 integral membrane protein [Nakamurella flavida]